MDKLRMQTANKADENYKKLAELFPDAVTETIDENGEVVRAIDKDVLMQEISCTVVEGRDERYQFTWPDKKKSILLANAPINKTLRPCREESVGKDGTPGGWDSENLYIEGDNLEVLKLLQETYLGKIKMIYIDPPYNTGNDFVYEDDFAQSTSEYIENSGQLDDEGNRLVQNTESNGRFHTDWLNMIYPRLKIAKDLLSDDGVIFISIDEHEAETLTKVCDEIMSESNHCGTIVIKSNPRGSMSTSEIASLHEYLLVYAKNRCNAAIIGHKLNDNMIAEYKYKDDIGKYRLLGLRMRGGFWRRSERPSLYFPIFINPQDETVSTKYDENYSAKVLPIQPSTNEDGTWRWGREKVEADKNLLIGRKVKRNGEEVWDIFQKDYFIRDNERRTKAKSIWDESELNYQNGSSEIKKLLNSSGIFDYSKPVFLLKHIMEMINLKDDDIVLDFFSGSATTAHAVMQVNAENGCNRKFIMVQLPEETDEKSEAYKAGYKNICEIGKERIRRAGKKIKEESPLTTEDLDVGFRVLKCDSSNMKDVYYNPGDYEQSLFDDLTDNIKKDRTPEDLLVQVMLDLGILLSSKIEERDIAGKHVFCVEDNFLMACFDDNVTDETVTAIAKQEPYYFVMRDSSLASDSVATNFDQIFNTYSPDTVRKVL